MGKHRPHRQHERVCEVCGKSFISRTYNGRFCSALCRLHNWRNLHRERHSLEKLNRKKEKEQKRLKIPRICRHCGKSFYSGTVWTFCSEFCKLVAQREYSKQWHRIRHREILEYRRIHRSLPQVRMRRMLSKRLRDLLHGRRKAASMQKLLGCTRLELIKHLERQFQPGMTWDNYGKWHVDHIRAFAWFNLSDPEHQRIACNYKNLRPLWGSENSARGTKSTY